MKTMNDENGDLSETVGQAADAAETDTLEQLRTENEQLKAAIRLGQARRQITAELEKVGARSPELLFASVQGDLQFNEDGTLVNSAAVVARLKTDYPEQFGGLAAGPIDAGSGASRQELTRSALAKMTPAEIARLDWADVQRALMK